MGWEKACKAQFWFSIRFALDFYLSFVRIEQVLIYDLHWNTGELILDWLVRICQSNVRWIFLSALGDLHQAEHSIRVENKRSP